jgi:PAS domain S-box-containing protein
LNTSSFFKQLFDTARSNGILILNDEGIILAINPAFTIRFGYNEEDLKGRNFSMLFIEKDRAVYKPETELQQVCTEGSANDENYLVNKDGNKIWTAGESVLVEENEEKFIVKIVHNIHAQKQLERFLIQSHEFIDTIFDSITESALLLLDSRIRVVKVNHVFMELFGLQKTPAEGSRLSDIDNPFWLRPEVKKELVNFLVTHNTSDKKIFDFENSSGKNIQLEFHAKIIEGVPGTEKKIFLMIKQHI